MLVLYKWRFAESPWSQIYVTLPAQESDRVFERAHELLREHGYNEAADLVTKFSLEIVHPHDPRKPSLHITASESELVQLRGIAPDVFRELARAMGNAGSYLQAIFADTTGSDQPLAYDAHVTTSPRDINIRTEGRHASIGPLLWEKVPPLAVITGVNGAGKSQLLQVLASSCGVGDASVSKAWADFEGEHYAAGEVFYSAGKWEAISSVIASEARIREAIQEVQTIRRNMPHERYIARKLRMSVDGLRRMTPSQFQHVLTPGMLWTYAPAQFHSISLLFLAHRFFERQARETGEDVDVTRQRLGEPPWDLLSSVIKAAGLAFTFIIPPPLGPTRPTSNEQFEFELKDREGNVVPMDELSDGERVLLATSVWRYHADLAGRHRRLFLLDEPDAHLHPSLTRRFLKILATTFVKERGARVIFTTHSPSTVALAPEGSLFQMQRQHPRISPVSRADAIALLTDGFVAVQDSTRTVFLEGKNDPIFYRGVWQRFIEQPVSGQMGRLKPYPNLHFVYGQGKSTILALVPQLRSNGFTNFLGMIDRDVANTPVDGVFVLARYAVENYVYDPLNIYFYLRALGRAPSLPADLDEHIDLRRSPDALQSIIDTVVRHVEAQYSPKPKEQERTPVNYSGFTLMYPAWVFTWSKRDVKDRFNRVFMQFRFEELVTNYFDLNLIPEDIVDLYRQLQGGGHVDA